MVTGHIRGRACVAWLPHSAGRSALAPISQKWLFVVLARRGPYLTSYSHQSTAPRRYGQVSARDSSNGSLSGAPASSREGPGATAHEPPVATAQRRIEHLERLLFLRRFYRNVARARAAAAEPSGGYAPLTASEAAELAHEEDRGATERERWNVALAELAELQVIKDQILCDLKVLLPCAVSLFVSDAPPSDAAQAVGRRVLDSAEADALRALATGCCKVLDGRIAGGIEPLATSAGESSLMLRRRIVSQASQLGSNALAYAGSVAVRAPAKGGLGSRLRPAVRTATTVVAERGVPEAARVARAYLAGLWARLNGQRGTSADTLPLGLRAPVSIAGELRRRVEELQVRMEALERALREASKARESRLRRAPIELRASLAFEMLDMDADILRLGRELALCTLDVQLDAVALALDDELRAVFDAPLPPEFEPAGSGAVGGGSEGGAKRRSGRPSGAAAAAALRALAPRRGSTEELGVLLAQFSLLARRLATLRDAFERHAGGGASLMPAFDDEVRSVAEELAEARVRLGIADTAVFGGPSGSLGGGLRRLQMQTREGAATVREGVASFVLGVRMLGSDLAYAGRLFARASLGNTLKLREVAALRRTLLDVFSFVPFTVILIVPLTPLGHVLVFGFIQRYFPDFFPSQFNARRQAMVKRYETLREQLRRAQAAASHAEDEQELQQAAAAIARLTQPGNPAVLGEAPPGNGTLGSLGGGTGGAVLSREGLRRLEERVERAEVEYLAFGSDIDEPDGGTSEGSSDEQRKPR